MVFLISSITVAAFSSLCEAFGRSRPHLVQNLTSARTSVPQLGQNERPDERRGDLWLRQLFWDMGHGPVKVAGDAGGGRKDSDRVVSSVDEPRDWPGLVPFQDVRVPVAIRPHRR